MCGLTIRSCMCSASVLAGGGPTEEPDPPAVNQTLHRPPTSSRSLLPDGPQLQAEDCAEEGEESAFICAPPRLPHRHHLSLLMTALSLCVQVSSTAGRISVPRLSVGAVSSRPSTPTLGEQPGSDSSRCGNLWTPHDSITIKKLKNFVLARWV